ncbi:MAG TPA: type III pantothenate kinase [Thermoanaerobacterales bacterium]|nr:type III pantothenate kinase [Thermoanaerobacterales bacterium]
MILVIDVGNTNTALGVYEGEELKYNWRVTTRQQTSDELGLILKNLFDCEGIDRSKINSIIVCSVVPPLMPILERACAKHFGQWPLIVGPGTRTGINIKYDNPKEVGADRIVNAVAAYELYGGPAIIVDFGTATTFCAVNQHGEYIGGAISPGIKISTEALFTKAAKLPRIELDKPKSSIGRNTITSMQSGIVNGYIGLVEHMVNEFKNELEDSDAFAVATGGLGRLIGSECKNINEINPNLTLQGLRLIYEKNKCQL